MKPALLCYPKAVKGVTEEEPPTDTPHGHRGRDPELIKYTNREPGCHIPTTWGLSHECEFGLTPKNYAV